MKFAKPTKSKILWSRKFLGNFLGIENLTIVLAVVTLIVIGFNAFQMSQLNIGQNSITAQATAQSNPVKAASTKDIDAIDVIPKGIPSIYGKELGVSYDDISATNQQKADDTIRKLGILDQQITLSGNDLERYISVASQISCEYCCGVDSIIFKDGNPACGCQHSFAMRGLAKYLIKNHGSGYTNDEILEELGKWKTLFFPSPMAEKALVLKEKGIELNYINLASNKYRGIENGN
ncbi:hypothetical protein HYX04_01475 [Candidatus Woesearchaeota archaeon]|nr:hypothetical protein [Candidatus Woesearchaeota archaeon]